MTSRPSSFMPALLAFPLAAFFGLSSLAGILFPDIPYHNETRLWAAMGIGQDWIDLFIVVPLLIVSAAFTASGSTIFRVVLGGTLIYTLYSLVLYTFAMHFNPLFLIYCGGLGFAFYALVSLLVSYRTDSASTRVTARSPARTTGVFVTLLGATFYVLWLVEVIPAMFAGTVPTSIIDAGLITNPVHVLDLSIVLPAFVIAGVSLYRRRPLGCYLAPMLMVFGVIMDIALAGMVWSMSRRQLAAGGPPIGVFIGMAVLTGVMLWRYLRTTSGEGHASDVRCEDYH